MGGFIPPLLPSGSLPRHLHRPGPSGSADKPRATGRCEPPSR